MPYITTETVAMIRKTIKKNFPNVKFSITKEHYSGLNVKIMESTMDFNKCPKEGWEHLPERMWGYNPESTEFLQKLEDIIQGCHAQKEVVYDGDYGSVPNYYLNIGIGKWDKPYIQR
jgi:hypothetical protein